MPAPTAGLVLAAGAGRRFGAPKSTVVGADGVSWLRRAVRSLRDGGCHPVVVVLGAAAEEAATHLAAEDAAVAVVAADWEEGLSASLRAGLAAVAERPAVEAVVVTLVDLPDVGPEVVGRLLARGEIGAGTLLRATYDGRPGHPVVIGRDHWPALVASLAGDRGAGTYLGTHGAVGVECGDLAGGRDVDVRTPEASRRADEVGT